MKKLRKNFAGFANLDFFFLVGVLGAITESSGHIPAHVTAIELPRRALFFDRAKFLFPATQGTALATPLVEIEKIEELFGMGGDGAPPLFITVDGLQ